MNFLRIKNWNEFQHYKDRNPPWIKFHVALLDDYEFSSLSDINKAHLVLIWLFASKRDGSIPNDPKYLQAKLGLDKQPDLDALLAAGFLLDDGEESPAREKWASRYVSDDLREKLLELAGNKCRACESTEALEIDHIVPVSQGGDGSESNLQVLCRPCNRRKRMRSDSYAATEQVATQASGASVALARSREERREETEEKARQFGRFWSGYPKRIAKQAALKAWKKLTLTAEQFDSLMASLDAAKRSPDWLREAGRYIPHPATWLNGARWEDEAAAPKAAEWHP